MPGPDVPRTKKGSDRIMRQGHTDSGEFGTTPNPPQPVPGIGDEPKELHP